MKKYLLLMLLILVPFSVKANSNDKFVTEFDDDIIISEYISGSSVIGGNNVTIDGSIDGVGLIMGNIINYNSTTEYGIILGNTININGTLRDGLILGNVITIEKDSIIERDTAILGSNLTISGSFYRDVYLAGSTIELDNITIDGNIRVNGDNIIIKDNVIVNGKLSYNENATTNISSSAIITNISTYEADINDNDIASNNIKSGFISLINLLVIFAVTIFLIPKFYQKIVTNNDYLKNIGFGLLFLIIVPIIALILIISVLGISLGFISIGLYILCFMIAHIISGYYIGNLIWKKYIKKKEQPYLIGFMGIIIVYLLTLIPYLGNLISFISFLFAMGTICSLFKKKK